MKELEWIRKNIDYLDRQIAEKLVQRMHLMDKVAEIKAAGGIEVKDPDREEKVLDNVAGTAGVEYEESIKDIYRAIMEVSKAYQEKIMNEGK